jgi:hypothetical protein
MYLAGLFVRWRGRITLVLAPSVVDSIDLERFGSVRGRKEAQETVVLLLRSPDPNKNVVIAEDKVDTVRHNERILKDRF